jgi:hypothetical protein
MKAVVDVVRIKSDGKGSASRRRFEQLSGDANTILTNRTGR